jgi:hypothetical protein
MIRIFPEAWKREFPGQEEGCIKMLQKSMVIL